MLEAAAAGRDALLVAPTGGGKTLGGFLPSLVELAGAGVAGVPQGLHTLYVSPLKALTNDIARNLAAPVGEMGLPVSYEVRTGDTPSNRRERQRRKPPQMLLTTPESLALLLSYPDAGSYFAGLRRVVLDELHALAESKRGALLSLGLARLRALAPGATFAGLSATVADPDRLLRYLTPRPERAVVVRGEGGAEPDVRLLIPGDRMPWAGSVGLYAVPELYRLIRETRLAILFVNTRARAELVFGALWRENRDGLPIALHHGSLAVEQRRKVEAAMAEGRLRAVVATSSLDLGIDWGDVDLVVQVGAPKGAARLLQRIGRANHRLDEPSRAVLIPGNRFEVLECMAARGRAGRAHARRRPVFPGGLDVLAQHVARRGLQRPVRRRRALRRGDGCRPVREPRPQGLRRHARVRRHRRLRAAHLRALPPARARRGWAVAAGRPAAGARLPDERRHHRRRALDAGAARPQAAGRGRGDVRRQPRPGRHVPVRRPGAALRGHPRQRGGRHPGQGPRRAGRADLRRQPPAAQHPPRRPRPGPDRRPGGLAPAARRGARVAGRPGPARRRARGRTTSWSRASPGSGGTTSSPTASPAATRTRRSACC